MALGLGWSFVPVPSPPNGRKGAVLGSRPPPEAIGELGKIWPITVEPPLCAKYFPVQQPRKGRQICHPAHSADEETESRDGKQHARDHRAKVVVVGTRPRSAAVWAKPRPSRGRARGSSTSPQPSALAQWTPALKEALGRQWGSEK